MSETMVLRCEHLCKEYGSKRVLEDVTLQLEQGHICLQETLVDSLAQQLLNNPLVQAVVVRSEKTKAYPDVKSASVEIFRVCHD